MTGKVCARDEKILYRRLAHVQAEIVKWQIIEGDIRTQLTHLMIQRTGTFTAPRRLEVENADHVQTVPDKKGPQRK